MADKTYFLMMEYARIICLCIVGMTLIRALYMGIKHRNSLSKPFLLMYLLSLMISGIFVISGIIVVIMAILNQYNRYRVIGVSIYTGSGYLFLYLFCCQIYMKLSTAFIGTIYSISKGKHILIISSLIIIVICGLLNIILIGLISFEVAQLFIIPAFILYNWVSIYMVYIFVKTLIKLIKNNAKQDNTQMIKSVVGYIVTSIIAYTSSILLLGLCIVFVQLTLYPQIGYLLVIIDGFINLLALYFQYNFAGNDYDKCCISCHRLVLYCVNAKHTLKTDDTNTISISTIVNKTSNTVDNTTHEMVLY